MRTPIYSVFSIVILSGCGGGGSGSVSYDYADSYDYAEGPPSSVGNATTSLAGPSSNMSLPFTAPNGTTYSSLAAAHLVLNGVGSDFVATIDTGARTAWQQGWTGKNIKLGIADSFNSNGQIDVHGDWVALVASTVAPETKMAFRNVLSSSTLFGLIGDVNAAYDYFESNGYHIINNSWGIERPKRASDGSYNGQLHADFDALVQSTSEAFDPGSPSSAVGLYIVAGGNGGQHCPTRRIENCNWIAASAKKIRDNGYAAGSRLVFVGSLDDSTNDLAAYSYTAGALKNDFIVAHDDVLSPADAAGTSFSSPRVAGAAALVKHKFPNLSSAQIKQVLLQTAEDLGITGVDETFGHGKLSILNALSPQGTVVPR